MKDTAMNTRCNLLLVMAALLLAGRPVDAGESPYEKARRIVIPQLKMDDASPEEVFTFIRKQAKEQDPDRTGINIVYRLSPTGKHVFSQKSITMQLDNVPFADVVHYVHLITGLHYRYDNYALLIFDSDAAARNMTTRSYRVGAGVFDSRRTRGKPDDIDDRDEDD